MHGSKGRHRLGHWMPAGGDALEEWIGDLVSQVEAKKDRVTLHPVIEEFYELLDRDPLVRMYLNEMIEQESTRGRYQTSQLESVDQMLRLVNEVLTLAPEYDDTAMVGVPLNAILDRVMGTPAGFAAFRHETVNQMFKKILRAWCRFLSSKESLYVLNDTPKGWKCEGARRAMRIDDYVHDPDHEHWGFASWNDFFTRRFKDGARPIEDAGDDRVIVSACESTPYSIKSQVKTDDRFWIKAQPYSLRDMLASPEIAEEFEGGTVYQAFLSALNYHRWHSPVTGTIRKAFVKEGTYYSELEAEGDDPEGPDDSQGYLTHVATRAIVVVECDHAPVGLMAAVFVGMGDVSSCVIRGEIKPGARVKKGDELGHFQYGGSTHCLVFRQGAIGDFSLQAIPEPYNPRAPLVRLGTRIAAAPS